VILRGDAEPHAHGLAGVHEVHGADDGAQIVFEESQRAIYNGHGDDGDQSEAAVYGRLIRWGISDVGQRHQQAEAVSQTRVLAGLGQPAGELGSEAVDVRHGVYGVARQMTAAVWRGFAIDGHQFAYQEVQRIGREHGVHLRGGAVDAGVCAGGAALLPGVQGHENQRRGSLRARFWHVPGRVVPHRRGLGCAGGFDGDALRRPDVCHAGDGADFRKMIHSDRRAGEGHAKHEPDRGVLEGGFEENRRGLCLSFTAGAAEPHVSLRGDLRAVGGDLRFGARGGVQPVQAVCAGLSAGSKHL